MKRSAIFRSFTVLAVCICVAAGGVYASIGEELPPLHDGDLIFQTSMSSQLSAILFATADP
jgi:hypothetical protein